jgi:uroporphyrinogen decarboxylase
MDSWKRFINSINREPIDHIPLALIGTNRFYASLWNEDLFGVLHNPQKMIDIQVKTFKKFPQITFIPGAWPDYGVGILSSFGCQIKWQKRTMPQVSKEALLTDEDIEKIRIPDPQQDGFMPWYLQTLTMFLDQADFFEDNMHFLWSFGPGELASYLWGSCKFLGDLIQKPDLMIQLLDKVTLAIIRWLEAQQEINHSADAILLTDDISGLLSQKLYRKSLMPFQQKIIQAFPNHLIVFHNDTKSNHILSSIKELGIHVFNLGKSTNLELAEQIFGNDVSLMGNLDPMELLIKGSKDEIISEAQNRVTLVKNNPRFILSAGGGLNEGTPLSSLEALIKAVEK